MKILLYLLLSIFLLVIVVISINFHISFKVTLFNMEVRVFGIKVFHKKDDKMYEFITEQMKKKPKIKMSEGLKKAVLKTLKIEVIEFCYGGIDESPFAGLVIGFMNIVTSFLKRASFANAILVNYVFDEELKLAVSFKMRPVEFLYRYLKYRFVGKKHERQDEKRS